MNYKITYRINKTGKEGVKEFINRLTLDLWLKYYADKILILTYETY